MKFVREFAVKFGPYLAAWFLGALLAAVIYRPAHAAEGDLREIKLGSGGTQFQILVPFPAMGTKCIRFMDGSDGTTTGKTLGCWKMGAGLTVTGGDTLNATAAWADITGKPTFATVATTGAYSDLAGIPTTFSPSAHTHPANQISDSTATGRAVMTATDAATARAAIGAGTVTSITAGAGLTGGTITGSGTIALQARSFAYTTRALNTCYQISATRDAHVSYAVDIATASTLASGQAGTVYLRIYSNNTCTTGIQEVTRTSSGLSQGLGLSVGLNLNSTGVLAGIIPAGAWVQQVTENTTGAPTFTAKPGQEVLL